MPDLLPAPPQNPESEAFYAAARQGRFVLPRCQDCGRSHWYPRAACPFCFGPTRLEPASGRGRIYSFTVMRRAATPFAIAYVTLDEGPTMLTNIVGCELDALRIDMPVVIALSATDGGPPAPCFRPE